MTPRPRRRRWRRPSGAAVAGLQVLWLLAAVGAQSPSQFERTDPESVAKNTLLLGFDMITGQYRQSVGSEAEADLTTPRPQPWRIGKVHPAQALAHTPTTTISHEKKTA